MFPNQIPKAGKLTKNDSILQLSLLETESTSEAKKVSLKNV